MSAASDELLKCPLRNVMPQIDSRRGDLVSVSSEMCGTLASDAGACSLQRRVQFGNKRYLVRAFIDVDREPNEVGTVYRSSTIAKYWRIEP